MSDRDIAVKTLVAAYKDVLRRLREARTEAQGITDKIYEHFLEWTKEKGGEKPRYLFVLMDQFYDEMGIKDPHVRTGLSIRFDKRIWRERP